MLEAGLISAGVRARTGWEPVVAAILGFGLCVACVDSAGKDPKSPWTRFVQVDGQPEPVPEQWVATPEGKFAHSIRIPNPVPKDSGYRRGMTSEQYFEHLCRTEAGEFIFKTVENVEGFYFMRPPKWPTDDNLKDRYKLEAPEIERTFQLFRATPEERGQIFINPPWALYAFVEEPSQTKQLREPFVRIRGYQQRVSPNQVEAISQLASRYGLTWRGLKRRYDRELAIAGSEWLVLDLRTYEVMAIERNFARTGRTRNAPEGIWWLNALNCPGTRTRNILTRRFYEFAAKVLTPNSGEDNER